MDMFERGAGLNRCPESIGTQGPHAVRYLPMKHTARFKIGLLALGAKSKERTRRFREVQDGWIVSVDFVSPHLGLGE